MLYGFLSQFRFHDEGDLGGSSSGQQPQAGDGQQPQAGGGTTPSDTPAETETLSLEEARKLRSEAASLRKRLRDQEAADEQRKQSEMTEAQKLEQRATRAEQEREQLQKDLREERTRRAVGTAAAKFNVPADLAERLVEIEYDETGTPIGVEQAVQALVAKYPNLAAGASITAPVSTSSAMNPQRSATLPLTPEDIKKMTPQQINARWDEVQKALAGQK